MTSGKRNIPMTKAVRGRIHSHFSAVASKGMLNAQKTLFISHRNTIRGIVSLNRITLSFTNNRILRKILNAFDCSLSTHKFLATCFYAVVEAINFPHFPQTTISPTLFFFSVKEWTKLHQNWLVTTRICH